MLNLSDKELDRFSQEAAQEYEPGDVLGPRSWEKLEVRMTQEFGRPGWNPIRHIRRFPFYYAPALLLLLGVGYFLVRPGVSSGSSLGATAAKTPAQATISVPTQKSADKATSTSAVSSSPTAPQGGGTGAAGTGVADAARGGASADGAVAGGAPVTPGGASRHAASREGASREGAVASGTGPSGKLGGTMTRDSKGNGHAIQGASGSRSRVHGISGNRAGGNGGDDNRIAITTPMNPGRGQGNAKRGTAGAGTRGAGAMGAGTTERELSRSNVQQPRSLAKRVMIGDSALRAFNAKSGVPALIHKKGIYEINRKWQFGLTLAPDFTSVNSLAGDKAGSSIGLTVDYLFAPHWYLNTGILATRRNYAARNQDYHAPPAFYLQNNIYGAVNFVKGSFYMMEIPLNLRYDFSVAGNTLFFVSAGSSSYFLTTENANLYWQHFNRDMCSPVDHLPIHQTNLFSTVNLSAGVEAGLSNSLSLLVAPYMKLPAKKLGLGQVQMNSVGIDFTLKWAPVTSRKRH